MLNVIPQAVNTLLSQLTGERFDQLAANSPDYNVALRNSRCAEAKKCQPRNLVEETEKIKALADQERRLKREVLSELEEGRKGSNNSFCGIVEAVYLEAKRAGNTENRAGIAEYIDQYIAAQREILNKSESWRTVATDIGFRAFC